jgi:Fic family protein
MSGIDRLREAIANKKAELDRLRCFAAGALGNLEQAHDLELTYTSNAIEGNTLSAAETALVIEHGITIGVQAAERPPGGNRPLRGAALCP